MANSSDVAAHASRLPLKHGHSSDRDRQKNGTERTRFVVDVADLMMIHLRESGHLVFRGPSAHNAEHTTA